MCKTRILKKNINPSTNSTINEKTKILYGIELRDKFSAICRADLMSRILNKTNNSNMLLRSHKIISENINKNYLVYNGYKRVGLYIKKNMLGFKVGEFIPSKKIKHTKETFSAFRIYNRRRSSRKKKIKIKNIKNRLVKLSKVVNFKDLKKSMQEAVLDIECKYQCDLYFIDFLKY